MKSRQPTSLFPLCLRFTKQAQKDVKKLAASGLRPKAEALLSILQKNPFQNPPLCEKLLGYLAGTYSSRINIQHRLVYRVFDKKKTVKIIRMWTYYE